MSGLAPANGRSLLPNFASVPQLSVPVLPGTNSAGVPPRGASPALPALCRDPSHASLIAPPTDAYIRPSSFGDSGNLQPLVDVIVDDDGDVVASIGPSLLQQIVAAQPAPGFTLVEMMYEIVYARGSRSPGGRVISGLPSSVALGLWTLRPNGELLHRAVNGSGPGTVIANKSPSWCSATAQDLFINVA